MKRSTIAVSLLTALVVPNVLAVELYKDQNATINASGNISVAGVHHNDETEFVNNGSRIHIDATHNIMGGEGMMSGWSVMGVFEWGINPIGDNELVFNNNSLFEKDKNDFIYNRLGYIGLMHDKYGSLTFGKQWSPWHDVVKDTDQGMVFDGDASGAATFKGDGAINGVGRSDQAIQYRNTFGNLSIALQAQIKQDSFDIVVNRGELRYPLIEPHVPVGTKVKVEHNNTYGGSIKYQLPMNLMFTAGYNTGKFEVKSLLGRDHSRTDKIYGAGLVYGDWDSQGFFAAVNANKNEFHDTDNIGRIIPKSTGFESAFAYHFDNGLRVLLEYNQLEADDSYQQNFNGDKFKRENVIGSLQYQWDSHVLVFIEGRLDQSDFEGRFKYRMHEQDDDSVAVGLKYSF